MQKRLKIALTHGDFNGVGYEVIQKTLADERILELFTPVVYGSKQIWEQYQSILGIPGLKGLNMVKHPHAAKEEQINMIDITRGEEQVVVQPGSADVVAGLYAARALQQAREDLLKGSIDAVVTAPINKDVVQSSGFHFSGHTEFFEEPFPETTAVKLFVAGGLRVALHTMHTPLSAVPKAVTLSSVTKSISSLSRALRQDFGVVKPKIAVLGLNPHAGEQGRLGLEEDEVLKPTIKAAWEAGELVFGPFPADGYWGNGDYKHFDATLAIYHDQGLIPFKLLAMMEGVNISSGLPIIRTSPDHGTAFDIAGQGKADATSFRNAIFQAIDIHRCRTTYLEASKNPLQKRYVDKGKDNVKLDLSKSDDEE